jgi:predicted ester cyclase
MTSETADSGVSAGIERVVRRFYDEVWNGRDYAVAEELFDPEFSYPAAPGLKGAEAKLRAVCSMHQSFPDLQVTIEELVISADHAAVRGAITGTDLGGLGGRPPTGRKVSSWGVDFFGFRDQRIVSDWVGADWLGILIQLGVVSDPWAAHGGH